jgi:cytochrome c oxidase subunit 2
VRGKAKWFAGALFLVLALAACRDNLPQSPLNPASPDAKTEFNLYSLVFWIAVVVFILVEGLLLLFIVKYRHKPGRKASQVHGNTRLEIGWTIAPALLLAIIAVPTVTTIFALAQKPTGNVLNVTVAGHQWWWEFDYPDAKVTTANELHIPIGRPVYIHLCSYGATGTSEGLPNPTANGTMPVGNGPALGAGTDCNANPGVPIGNAVIHSFWVPRLAGKEDVVPGQSNTLTIQADEPGTYLGQCAEYCAWSHAYMRFHVVAQTPDDYAAWVRAQQQEAATPAEGTLAMKGAETFGAIGSGGGVGCTACHSISGTAAQSAGGPNLTHFASRECFAGCSLTRTDENIQTWLRDPAAVKPGAFMPNYHLTQDEITALVAYLQSLK